MCEARHRFKPVAREVRLTSFLIEKPSFWAKTDKTASFLMKWYPAVFASLRLSMDAETVPAGRCCISVSTLCSFLLHRWPKCQPPGPSLRTPTIQDPVLSPTRSSRANWSLPNMAASCSSGTGEAAVSFQSHVLCPKTRPLQKVKISQEWARALRMSVLASFCNLYKALRAWFWTELMS